MHAPLHPWERVLWTRKPLLRPGTLYALTDLRLFAARGRRLWEIALQDIGEVEHRRSRLDRLIGTSTVVAHARHPRRAPVVVPHVRHGTQLAALVELLAGDPQASLDAAAVETALSWEPSAERPWRGALAAAAVILLALFAVTTRLQSSTRAVVYSPDDPIYPGGSKRSREEIVRFMEADVMPWARVALGRLKGGPERITCATCHGEDAESRGWQMPAVAALPEPHLRQLGWETYSANMDTQMRNAIYGYLAESDNQHRAAYMREVVLPGMARLLNRPAYDFTKTYEHNRSRAAFGCYHCHKVR